MNYGRFKKIIVPLVKMCVFAIPVTMTFNHPVYGQSGVYSDVAQGAPYSPQRPAGQPPPGYPPVAQPVPGGYPIPQQPNPPGGYPDFSEYNRSVVANIRASGSLRVGTVQFINDYGGPVNIDIYHADVPDRQFGQWIFNPGVVPSISTQVGPNVTPIVIGNDWGIRVRLANGLTSKVYPFSRVSRFEGGKINVRATDVFRGRAEIPSPIPQINRDVGHQPSISRRPLAVFVNGYTNCCAHGMNDLQERLKSIGFEILEVPYTQFVHGAASGVVMGSDDEAFLHGGAAYLNHPTNINRPLVLIGHSYGGDSVLKLLSRLKRRIQFVGVIDPVAIGGYRWNLGKHTVPDNVDYFFNRWQNNRPDVDINPRNLFDPDKNVVNLKVLPFDYGSSGSIPCLAKKCDQAKQPFETAWDGKVLRKKCEWYETCSYQNIRATHARLPQDSYIQRLIGDRIIEMILSSRRRVDVPEKPVPPP